MRQNDQLLRSKSISEIVMGPMDAKYIARVWWYLEKDLGCRVRYLRDQNKYHITFPAGTRESTYAGQSTHWSVALTSLHIFS